MRNFKRFMAVFAALAITACAAKAQYYQIANQVTDMLQTALIGGFNYRGMADVSYQRGLGTNRADVFEVTTTQGVKYSNWFFMGVGAGLDVLFADTGETMLSTSNGKGLTQTGYMIPLYSDFRFNIGSQSSVSAFIDVRIGASFLMNNDYLQLANGYINRSECFYLKPAVGLRVPLSSKNPKLACNLGFCYTLIGTDYWYNYSSNNINLSSMGLSVGLEW